MVDDRGDAEQSRCPAVILKVPEEEGEDQSDTEAHEPGDEQEGSAFQILELLQHGHPFRDLSHRLSEHFRLEIDTEKLRKLLSRIVEKIYLVFGRLRLWIHRSRRVLETG